MPNYRPPEVLTGTPGKVTLARGTLLYRVHGSHRAAADFNTKAAHCLYGAAASMPPTTRATGICTQG